MMASRAPRDLAAIGEDEEEGRNLSFDHDDLPTSSSFAQIDRPINDTYEYDDMHCKITEDRLARARSMAGAKSCHLNEKELAALREEQNHLLHEDDQYCTATLESKARAEEKSRSEIKSLRREMLQAMGRARADKSNDGVLGVQPMGNVANSLIASSALFSASNRDLSYLLEEEQDDQEESKTQHDALYERRKNRIHILVKNKCFDAADVTYVRKPDVAQLAEKEYQAYSSRRKYTLRQVLLSRRFHLYKHRFSNAQFRRTLVYPTLPQPVDIYAGSTPGYICEECSDPDTMATTEKDRSRPNGHRFILAADTQFGILMDGYAMQNPNWSDEIELSRQAVAKINAMTGKDRPLYVCVCGDLVDTESSFSRALASWKKVMSGWERNLVFAQQVKDFKRIWASLDPDIALLCLCGNHDVGNRPTEQSIERWTSSFGDDFFAFWCNKTFNIFLNNCLFSDPTGAPDLFKEQHMWLEEKLAYATANDATHIFVYGHFPWFLKHELEKDSEISSFSAVPEGWGPPGTKFPDGYFTIPYEERQMAMILFQRYNVTACFSGHFHQNVIARTSWGMPMIVTGPLSMTLKSEINDELSAGEPHGVGMRVVDVGERGEFVHKFIPLSADFDKRD